MASMADQKAGGSSRSKRTRKKSPPKEAEQEAPENTEDAPPEEEAPEDTEVAPEEEAPEDAEVAQQEEDTEAVDDEPVPEEDTEAVDEVPMEDGTEAEEHGSGSAEQAARRAARQVADLTGKRPESVVSLERSDDGWKVGIEVVESPRIPDTADILATYEVQLGRDGTLRSYRRTRRYARGQLDRKCQ